MAGSPYQDLDRPPLRVAALRRALVGRGGFVRELRVVAETGSTNADLRAAARAGAPEGTVLVAEHQHAGRGRLDRSWLSVPRAGLTCSVLLRPDVPAPRWPWLPLLAGCAVCEAVRRGAGVEVALKWPNDVLVGDAKVAGVLVERVATATGPAAVVGIGLNVTTTAAELGPLHPAATSLALAGATRLDRDPLLRELLRVLGSCYRAWCAAGGDPDCGVGAAYRARCATVGRAVRVELGAGEYARGEAVGIDDDGRLVVATGAGARAFSAGDVTHLR